MSRSMFVRRLVYVGSEAEPGEPLRLEGEPLQPGARIALERKRSPWSDRRRVERVLVGTHPARADLLLEGTGLCPEHVRFYLPRAAAEPNDLKVIEPAEVRVNGRAIAPHEWLPMRDGDRLELGPWLFRFEQEAVE